MLQSKLHPTLVKDCIPAGSLSACTLLLMNDSQYPWLILVPDRPGLKDLDELTEADATLVQADIKWACQALRTLFQPDKLNVAALGNMVPQLHIHVIARFASDRAWPKPVWGLHPPAPYDNETLSDRLSQIKALINPTKR
ncbi:MAG: HIT domain-containing protein [Magnetococcales bacterium]|nr:HIT domain-containing protein [Magnetococcales bacterium]MBF0631838.1 HIT domain-containing protein [Magnetococcales bacterium]